MNEPDVIVLLKCAVSCLPIYPSHGMKQSPVECSEGRLNNVNGG